MARSGFKLRFANQCRLVILVTAVACSTSAVVSAASETERALRPHLAKFCIGCHGAKKAEADLNLERLLDQPGGLTSSPLLLEDILFVIEDEQMPPKKAKHHPNVDERRAMIGAIDRLLRTLEAAQKDDPGRVLMPRLTPDEYRHVIRDLTGVDFDPSRFIPAAGGAGEGFSNVGEAQIWSAGQFEKHLAAAKEVLGHLRVSPTEGFIWQADRRNDLSTDREHRAELIEHMRRWYNDREEIESQRVEAHLLRISKSADSAHGPYLFAAWRYRHRGALGMPDATITTVAEQSPHALRPDVLRRWVHVLNDSDELMTMAQLGRDLWRDIPGPDEVSEQDARRACFALADWWSTIAEKWWSSKLEFDYEKTPDVKVTNDGVWPFVIDIGRADRLYLVTTDMADRHEDDVVVWRDGAFLMSDGTKTPWDHASVKIESQRDDATIERGDDGRFIVHSPGLMSIAVPQGAEQFEVTAETSPEHRSRQTLVQVAVTHERPPAAHVRFMPERRPLGAPGVNVGGARNQLTRLQVDQHTFGRNRQYLSFKKTGLASELNIVADLLDRVSVEDLGGPWTDQRINGTTGPLHLTPADLRELSDDESLAGLRRMQGDLLTVAFPARQRLTRFLHDRGATDAGEGVTASRETIVTWDASTRAQHQQLLDAVEIQESPLRVEVRGWLAEFARRAWRRPINDAEVEALVSLYDRARSQGSGFDAAVKTPLAVVLTSPHFLYRYQHARQADGAYALNDIELASRLSFFLWSSVPDERLLTLAERGELSNPEVLLAETRRMLADGRVRRLAEGFAGQWLKFADFPRFDRPDAERFPEFTPQLRDAMYEEVVCFFEDLLRHDRPLTNLIRSDYTFLNEALAKHYGVSGVEGDEMRRVDVPAAQRGGIFGMGVFLTRTSTPLRTSPVIRGVWLLEDVLGEHLPSPPADVEPLSDDETGADGLTIAHQLAQHRADPACAGCHDRIDPLGLPLENFDPIGRWRIVDRAGNPIDALGAAGGESINGFTGLRDHLDQRRDQLMRNLTRKLLGYALGRGVQLGDAPLLRKMNDTLADNDYRPTAVIEQIVASPQFRTRRDHVTQATAEVTR